MPAPMVKTKDPGIYKRGKRFVVVYYVDGRQRKETTGSLAAARRLKRKRQVEADEGTHVEASRLKFSDYALEWIDRYHGKPGREFRESTRDDYRRDLKFSIEFFGPAKQIGQISSRDVNRFVNWLSDPKKQGKVFAPSTLRNKVAPLAACLGTAYAEELIPNNPAINVNYPGKRITATLAAGDLEGESAEASRAFDETQLAWLLAVAPERYRLLFEFAALTGVRVSELRALQWRHLDLDGIDGPPKAQVRRQYYRGRLQPPKSRYGKRDIPLSPALADALHAHKTASLFSGDTDLVFPGAVGKPFSSSNVAAKVLKPAAAEAGVPWASFHTFRHTCASLLFAEGRNIVQVQRWMGHHSPDFTLRTYVHLMSDGVGEGLSFTAAPAIEPEAMELAMDQPEVTGIYVGV